MPGVEEAEGRRGVVAWLEPPAGETAGDGEAAEVDASRPGAGADAGPSSGAREIQLLALPDFDDQRMDRVLPREGRFPPRRGEIVFERSALRLVDLEVGDEVVVRTASGRERALRVAGLAYEPGASPAYYFGRLNAYVTFETLADLGWPDSFNELRIRADSSVTGRAAMQQLADSVRQRIERAGAAVTFALVPEPGRHPAQELVAAVFIVLGAIGFLSLFVAGFLIVNTVNVLMAQQVRQIGILKVVGARERQIAGLYLGLVALYAGVGLAIAIPLAAVASVGLTAVATGLLNVDLATVVVPAQVVALEVAAGLAIPLLAALVPVHRGSRTTVHEALTSTGMDEHFGRGAFDRLLVGVRGLSRPFLLALRSTFRRKGRLALTLAALTLGGAVFMTIFTVRGSLFATLADTVRYFDYDVQVQLAEPARAETVAAEVLSVPGTTAAETWRFASAQRIRPDGTESGALVTFGLPAETDTVQPIVMEGRWLLPGEGNALVVTANLRRDEPDLQVGDRLTMRIAGRDSEWTLVGIVQSPTFAPFLYVDADTLGRHLGDAERAGMVMVKTSRPRCAGPGRGGQGAPRSPRAVGDRRRLDDDDAGRHGHAVHGLRHAGRRRLGDGGPARRRRRARPGRDDDDERRRALPGDRRHAGDRGHRRHRPRDLRRGGRPHRAPRLAFRSAPLPPAQQGPVRPPRRRVRPAPARLRAVARGSPPVARGGALAVRRGELRARLAGLADRRARGAGV